MNISLDDSIELLRRSDNHIEKSNGKLVSILMNKLCLDGLHLIQL